MFKHFKEKTKGLITGVLIGSMVTGGIAAFAAQGNLTIDVFYNNIKLVIDDILVNPTDANGNTVEPFIYNGTTYLPVRAIGKALGKEVNWDENTSTVYLGGGGESTPNDNSVPTTMLGNTFTTTMKKDTITNMAGEKIAITYPLFTFDYPNGWTISQDGVGDSQERVTLKNARGVTINYYTISANYMSTSRAFGSRYDISKVADSSYVPVATDYADLGEFIVAKLKVTGTIGSITDYKVVDTDGSTTYAVILASDIGTKTTNRPTDITEFCNIDNISFTASAPDGKFTEEEEQEVIAILQSFRLTPNE